MTSILKTSTVLPAFLIALVLSFCSCGEKTPEEVEYIYEFHNQYTPTHTHHIIPDSVDLYVDYTTATEMKGKIKFYWEVMKPILAAKAQNYYAIKGQDISREAGKVGELLAGVRNYENPDLKGVLKRIVGGDNEAILITDGELIDPSTPYMKDSFKSWLMKGHDIFIASEPYFEGGKNGAAKKLFFFIFYDSRVENNICDYVKRMAKFNHYPKVSTLNLSITPVVKGIHGGHSDPNSYVQAMVTRKGDMELQEWSTGWEDKIERFIVNDKDPKGALLIDGLQLDRTSIAGVRITEVSEKVYNLNNEYTNFFNAKKTEQEVDSLIDPDVMENFIVMDQNVFKRNSFLRLYFDKQNYNPADLTGNPYNYFKIAFFVSEIEQNMEKFRSKLEFDDRLKPGFKNVSVYESVKQTMEDPEITEFLANTPFYSIYVKALAR